MLASTWRSRRQQSNDLQVRPSQLHRRLAGCIDGAEIGARVQEQFDAFRVAARGRPVQGPPVSVWVTLVRGRAVPLEELLELLWLVQRRVNRRGVLMDAIEERLVGLDGDAGGDGEGAATTLRLVQLGRAQEWLLVGRLLAYRAQEVRVVAEERLGVPAAGRDAQCGRALPVQLERSAQERRPALVARRTQAVRLVVEECRFAGRAVPAARLASPAARLPIPAVPVRLVAPADRDAQSSAATRRRVPLG